MVKLIIEDDEGKTTVVPLIRDEITIGRKEGNTIRLTERNVSRRHAKLLRQNGAIFIEDLKSYNGIKVNGNKINGRVAITEGDRVQIGDYVLGLKIEAAAAAEEPAFQDQKTEEFDGLADEARTAEIDLEDAEKAIETHKQQKKKKKQKQKQKRAEPEAEAARVTREERGRLVCVSSNFAGEDWSLERPMMVIGRTDDNEIHINHRSISRHHARVTHKEGRYTILDLQSANGVRVNGEEYGKVELRAGDMVDLGHVRLRFVAAGEAFDFARDATVVDISQPEKSRSPLIYVLVALAVAVLGGLIYFLYPRDQELTPAAGSASTAPAEVPPDSGPAVAALDSGAGAAASAVDSSKVIALIKQAVTEEQWDEAQKNCGKLSGDALQQAQTSCDQATQEKAAYQLYEKFRSAATRNDHLEAVRAYNQIPKTSVYKTRDQQIYKDARDKYLAQATKELDDLLRKHDCDDARSLADRIREVDPEDTTAADRAGKCKPPDVVALKPPRPKPAAGDPVRPKPKPKPKPKPRPRPDQTTSLEDLEQAKEIVNQASQAYIAGNHARAIQLGRKALKLSSKNRMAIQIIGASSCYQKKLKDAQWAYKRLPDQTRKLLKKVCQRNGLTLE